MRIQPHPRRHRIREQRVGDLLLAQAAREQRHLVADVGRDVGRDVVVVHRRTLRVFVLALPVGVAVVVANGAISTAVGIRTYAAAVGTGSFDPGELSKESTRLVGPLTCREVKLEKGDGLAGESESGGAGSSSGSESESVSPRRVSAFGSISGLLSTGEELSGLAARRAFWAPPRFRSVTKETADATRASAASNDLTPDDVVADVADGVEVDVDVDVGVDVDVDVDAAAAAASVSRRFAFDGLRLGFVGDHGLRTFAFRLGSA